MKKLLSISTFSLLALGLAFATPASAQVKPGTCNGTGQGMGHGGSHGTCTGTGQGTGQGKVGPNFVDANGDGICDHFADGTSKQRRRDGSCGMVPKTGTGATAKPKANSK